MFNQILTSSYNDIIAQVPSSVKFIQGWDKMRRKYNMVFSLFLGVEQYPAFYACVLEFSPFCDKITTPLLPSTVMT